MPITVMASTTVKPYPAFSDAKCWRTATRYKSNFRVANFDSEVPALNRRELGANPRRPTILPMWLSSDSSSFVNCRALPHESASLSIGSVSASVVKLLSSSASNGEFAGGSPAGCTNSCRVSPTTRGAPLRPERLGVEIPHAAPFCPRSPMERQRT